MSWKETDVMDERMKFVVAWRSSKMCNPCARIKVSPMFPIAHLPRPTADSKFGKGYHAGNCAP